MLITETRMKRFNMDYDDKLSHLNLTEFEDQVTEVMHQMRACKLIIKKIE